MLDRLEVARGEVDPWPDSAPATPRDVFVQRAMLPAFATARWRDQAPRRWMACIRLRPRPRRKRRWPSPWRCAKRSRRRAAPRRW
ncbi:hypothetical protein E6W36_02330 [Hankyongella ginsenosidimutans]|uniref:Uncharacterized protein n=1 Tax=Hankyongella ginsenosidimutans TaxID=1763828 RepID=A0A4D7BTG1_9SPHN|nr:hypothetical protein [Hankyongella ginsenosidimutans]QCI78859.1 hypothetical protein E6W36_02330 [Hankyongella ginsenosidimutans]